MARAVGSGARTRIPCQAMDRREFTLPSGRRADAVNLRMREVVELKPNNPRAIAGGQRQLEAYARELEELYPGAPFTRRLETYDRP